MGKLLHLAVAEAYPRTAELVGIDEDHTHIAKAEGLLSGITRADLDRLHPDMALRFARALRRIADIADPPPVRKPTFQ